nr:hypothetical protein [Macrococcus carouselicus]
MIHQDLSPAAVIMKAKASRQFAGELIPCVKTLYNWIDQKLIRTRNIDLLMKLRLKPRKPKGFTKGNRRVLSANLLNPVLKSLMHILPSVIGR